MGAFFLVLKLNATFPKLSDYKIRSQKNIFMKNLAKAFSLLLILIFSSCENEPINPMEYPTNFIFVDSELYELVERVIDDDPNINISCIDFNYSFPLFIFDANQEFLRAEGVYNNAQFSQLLGNLQEGESISLSYPISGTNENGDFIEINTNEELKLAIDTCVDEQILNECNGALCTPQCAWAITNHSGGSSNFEGTVLKIDSQGILNFIDGPTVYFGTWITYFTENQLYINIALNDEGEVGQNFNFEWKLDYSSNETMGLSNGDKAFTIMIDCELPCSEEIYTQCDFETGKAVFSLQEYIVCFGFNFGDELFNPLEFSFYESQEDAENGINPISSTEYINIANPQTIYARSVDSETGEISAYTIFTIEAVPCP